MRGRIVGSMEGGKENPHQPSAPGWWRLIKNKEVCETKQITNARVLYCKSDAKKKKAPTG